MPRMKFLTTTEQQAFDSPPEFNASERKRFFVITDGLQKILDSLKTPTNQVCFVLSVGYFRAAKRFFSRQFREADVRFVAARLGYIPEVVGVEEYEKSRFTRHRNQILDYLGYGVFDAAVANELTPHIRSMVRARMAPKFILARLVEILESAKTEVPSARILAELIGDETQRHEAELSALLINELTSKQRALLNDLFDKEGDSDASRMKLTLLKRFSQSTKPRNPFVPMHLIVVN